MSCLQQVQLKTSNINDVTVAYHRRTYTLVTSTDSSFYFYKQDNENGWKSIGEWNPSISIPTYKQKITIVACSPMEVFDAFIFIGVQKHRTFAIFVNTDGMFLNISEFLNLSGVVSVDFDQQRKELFAVTKDSTVMIFAIRSSIEKYRSSEDKRVILERNIFTPFIRGTVILISDSGRKGLQISTQDVKNTFLLLSIDGNVTGWDSNTLELLWKIERSFFIYPPRRISANKFGEDFIIFCEDPTEVEKRRLEYWYPPLDFTLCHAGQFGRMAIPFRHEILGLQLESINQRLGTLLIVFTNDRSVQLWKVSSSRVHHECSINLYGNSGKFGLSEQTVGPPPNQILAKSEIENSNGQVNIQIKEEIISKCLVAFSPSIKSSTSPLSILGFIGSNTCEILLHINNQANEIRKFADLSSLPNLKHYSVYEDQKVMMSDVNGNLTITKTNAATAGVLNAIPSELRAPFLHNIINQTSNEHNNNTTNSNNETDLNIEMNKPPTAMSDSAFSDTIQDAEGEQQSQGFIGGSSLEEEFYDDSLPIYNNPELNYFVPFSSFSNHSLPCIPGKQGIQSDPERKDAIMSVLCSPSVILYQEKVTAPTKQFGKPTSTSPTTAVSSLLVTRHGLEHIVDKTHHAFTDTLDFIFTGITFQSGIFIGVTTLKELFVYDLCRDYAKKNDDKDEVEFASRKGYSPIRFDLPMLPEVTLTSFHVADIHISFPPDRVGPMGRLVGEGSIIFGQHILILCGDSEGRVHYVVCNRSAVITSGTIRGHRCPVECVLTTGSAVRGVWKVNSTLCLSADKTRQSLQLVPGAGSSIVSIAKDGEVIIWQPTFSLNEVNSVSRTFIPSKRDLILNTHKISWKMSGIFSQKMDEIPRHYEAHVPITATVDPTCMTLLLSRGDGILDQIPLPGLIAIDAPPPTSVTSWSQSTHIKKQSGIATVKSAVWSKKRHLRPIKSIRIWMETRDTLVREMSIDPSNTAKIDLAAVSGPSRECFIGYDLDSLCKLANTSVCVTSAADMSVVLWRFVVSRSMPNQTSPANLAVFNKYLHLFPCRRLCFSHPPLLSLCYPMQSNINTNPNIRNISDIDDGIWSLRMILKDNIVTGIEGKFRDLMTVHELNDIEDQDMKKERNGQISISLMSINSESSSKSTSNSITTRVVSPMLIGEVEDYGTFVLMPVLCTVHKAAKLTEIMGKKKILSKPSWGILEEWKDKLNKLEIPINAAVELDLDISTDRIQNLLTSKTTFIERLDTSRVSPERGRAPLVQAVTIGDDDLEQTDTGFTTDGRKKITLHGVRMAISELLSIDTKNLNTTAPDNQNRQSQLSPVDDEIFDRKTASPKRKDTEGIDPGDYYQSDPEGALSSQSSSESLQKKALNLSLAEGDSIREKIQAQSSFEADLSDAGSIVPLPHTPQPLNFNQGSPFFGKGDSMYDMQNLLDMYSLTSADMTATGVRLSSAGQDSGKSLLDKLRSTSKTKKPAKTVYYVSKSKKSEMNQGRRQPYRGNTVYAPPPDASAINTELANLKTVVTSKPSQYRLSEEEPGHKAYLTRAVLGAVFNETADNKAFDVVVEATNDFGNMPSSYYDKNATPIYHRKKSMANDGEDEDDEIDFSELQSEYVETISLIEKSSLQSSDDSALKQYKSVKKTNFKPRVEQVKEIFSKILDARSARAAKAASSVPGAKPSIRLETIMQMEIIKDAIAAGYTTGHEVRDLFSRVVPASLKGKADLAAFTKFMIKFELMMNAKKDPPEVTFEVVAILHNELTIEVSVTKPGQVFGVIVRDDGQPPISSDFDDLEALVADESVLAVAQGKVVQEEEPIKLTFSDLNPETKYLLFLCAQHTNLRGQHHRMTDDMINGTKFNVVTAVEPQEIMTIEWCRLTEAMQDVEVMAAVREFEVQKLAKEEGVQLPSDEEIHHKKSVKFSKHWRDFINWWTDDDPVNGFGKARTLFHDREFLMVVKRETYRQKISDERYITETELKELTNLVAASDEDALLLSENETIIKFRSWYKGGRLVQRRSVDEVIQINVPSPAPAPPVKSGGDGSFDPTVMTDSVNDSTDNDSVKSSISVINLSTKSFHNNKNAVPQENLDKAKLQLEERTKLLELRVKAVDHAKALVNNLIEKNKIVESRKLTMNDVMVNRSKLKAEEVDAVMASLKLDQLCTQRDISIKNAATAGAQRISGASTFAVWDDEDFIPDKAPDIVTMTLPGTDRKPVKPWHLLSNMEKTLELRLACMLDSVIELAMKDLIIVPDIEDVAIDRTIYNVRGYHWDAFAEWYAGGEGSAKIPGYGTPTLARVITSDWERECVKKEQVLISFLLLPDLQAHHPDIAGYLPNDSDSLRTPMTQSVDQSLPSFDEAALISAYEKYVSSGEEGEILRVDFLKKFTGVLIRARQFTVLRHVWPPGPDKLGLHMMFPRMGLITPKYETAPRRLRLYKSRSLESYTLKEISNWYKEIELNEDDILLQVAESKGRKAQAYHNWLSKEDDRVQEARKLMMEEDFRSHLLRDYLFQIRVNESIERTEEQVKGLAFGSMNDVDWDSIKGVRFYQHGCGVENTDEIDDARAEVAKHVQELMNAAKLKKLKALEERRRLEEAERQRLLREEQDRRLAEGVARRAAIRAHLETIEINRRREAEALQRQLEEAALIEEERRRREREERELNKMFKEAERNRQRELRDMASEEFTQIERERIINEIRAMEHEDILSFVRGHEDEQRDRQRELRIKELKELYKPFIPYDFSKKKHYRKADKLGEMNTPIARKFSDVPGLTSSRSRKKSFAASIYEVENPFFDIETIRNKVSTSITMNPNELPRLGSPLSPKVLEGMNNTGMKLTSNIEDKYHMEVNVNENEDLDEEDFIIEEVVDDDETNRPFDESHLLYWKGPRKEIIQRYGKLRKRDRPYTNMMATTEVLLKPVLPVLPVADIPISNTLLLSGLPRSIALKAEWQRKKADREAAITKAESLQKMTKVKDKNRTYRSHSSENIRIKPSSPINTVPTSADLKQSGHSSHYDTATTSPTAPLEQMNPTYTLEPIISRKGLPQLSEKELIKFKRNNHFKKYWNHKKIDFMNSANDSLERIANERDKLTSYVNSDAYVEDDFYMYACQPGLRDASCVESSSIVANFYQSIDNRVGANLSEFRSSLEKEIVSDPIKNADSADSDDSSFVQAFQDQIEQQQRAFIGEMDSDSTMSKSLSEALDLKFSLEPVLPKERDWFKGKDDKRQTQTNPPFYRKTFGVLGASKPLLSESNPVKIVHDALKQDVEVNDKTSFKSTKAAKQRAVLGTLRRNGPSVTTQS